MSFLLRTARTPLTSRVISPARCFSTSIIYRKDVTETVKDAASTVNRKVADGAIKGIDLGEAATTKVKETLGVKSGEAKGQASELAGEAKGKANELAGEAKGKAAELKGKAKSNL